MNNGPAQMGNMGRSAMILGTVSGISTTVLVLLAETGNLQTLPAWMGFLLGGMSSTLLFIVFLQFLTALARQRQHLKLCLAGFVLAVLPILYALAESFLGTPSV